MLKLIGIGLYDEMDISLRGVEEGRSCDELFIETYTNVWHGSKEKLESIIGKKIEEIPRERVESDFLIEHSKHKDVCLFVVGDPLSATTHAELILEAKARGIKVKIVHSSSIFTAVGETGLQLYKFGKTVSVPKPQSQFRPTSFYDEIIKNKSNGLHTLVLFDVNDFSFNDAKEFLLSIDKEKIFDRVIVCSKLGSDDKKIIYGNIAEIEDVEPPFVIIVPGHLHFKEKEFLEMIK